MNLTIVRMEDTILDTLSLALSRIRRGHGHTGGSLKSLPESFARGISKHSRGNQGRNPLISFMSKEETDFSIMLEMLRNAGLEPITNGRRITLGKNDHDFQIVCSFSEDGKLISIRARY